MAGEHRRRSTAVPDRLVRRVSIPVRCSMEELSHRRSLRARCNRPPPGPRTGRVVPREHRSRNLLAATGPDRRRAQGSDSPPEPPARRPGHRRRVHAERHGVHRPPSLAAPDCVRHAAMWRARHATWGSSSRRSRWMTSTSGPGVRAPSSRDLRSSARKPPRRGWISAWKPDPCSIRHTARRERDPSGAREADFCLVPLRGACHAALGSASPERWDS